MAEALTNVIHGYLLGTQLGARFRDSTAYSLAAEAVHRRIFVYRVAPEAQVTCLAHLLNHGPDKGGCTRSSSTPSSWLTATSQPSRLWSGVTCSLSVVSGALKYAVWSSWLVS